MAKILIVDEEIETKNIIEKEFVEKENTLFYAENGKTALDVIKEHHDIDVILIDLETKIIGVSTIISLITNLNLPSKAVVLSGKRDINEINSAMKDGAFGFLLKPLEKNDVKNIIEKAITLNKKLKECDIMRLEKMASETMAMQNEINLEVERQNRLLTETLRQVVQNLTSSLKIEEVMNTLLKELRNFISYNQGIVYFCENDDKTKIGKIGDVNNSVLETMNCSQAIESIRNGLEGKKMAVLRKTEDSPFGEFILPEWKYFVVIPAFYRGDISAVVFLEIPEIFKYSEKQKQTIEIFMEQAAISIENAKLFKEVKHLAAIDELTGLFNRRHFFELAGAKLRKAQRYGEPLSVIMIDADDFKKYNDQYSHIIGDEILRHIAKSFKAATRESEIIGRYGGEEFVILLPETDIKLAAAIAERIRARVKEDKLKTEEYGNIGLTISLGVAHFEADDASIDEILSRADKALITSKNEGKDTVRVASGKKITVMDEI